MAQALSHLNGRLFWWWAIPSYFGGAVICWATGRLLRSWWQVERMIRSFDSHLRLV